MTTGVNRPLGKENLFHTVGAAKLLTPAYVDGDVFLVGDEAELSLQCTISGTAPTSVELTLERSADDGVTWVADLISGASVRSISANVLIVTVVSRWNRYRLKCKRTGGDATTALLVVGKAAYSAQTVTTSELLYATSEPTGFSDIQAAMSSLTISAVAATRIVTLTWAADTTYRYQGSLVTIGAGTAHTVTVSAASGEKYLGYNSAGVLTEIDITTEAAWRDYVFAALVYFDAATPAFSYIGKETHGLTMDWASHRAIHLSRGAAYLSGLATTLVAAVDSSGANDTHCQIAISSGSMMDEDIIHTITDGSPQDITPVLTAPKWYRLGATGVWTRTASGTFPVVPTGTGRAAWNQWTGATWQLTEASNSKFVVAYVYATADQSTPIHVIMGQNQYNSISEAQGAVASEIQRMAFDGLPVREMTPVSAILIQTASTYANAVKSRIRSTGSGGTHIDLRERVSAGSSMQITTIVPAIEDAGVTAYIGGSSAGSAAPTLREAIHTLSNAGTIDAYLPTATPGCRYTIHPTQTALCRVRCTGTDTYFGYTAGAPSDTIVQINSYYPWVRFECYVAGKWHVFFPEWNGRGYTTYNSPADLNENTAYTFSVPPYLDGSTYRAFELAFHFSSTGSAGARTIRARLNGTALGTTALPLGSYGGGTSTINTLNGYMVSGASTIFHLWMIYDNTRPYNYAPYNFVGGTNVATNTFTVTVQLANVADSIQFLYANLKLNQANSGYGC